MVTGWGLCTEHQRMFDDRYVALVECDPQRSGLSAAGDKLKPELGLSDQPAGARLARGVRQAVRHEVRAGQASVFVDPEVMDWLHRITETTG